MKAIFKNIGPVNNAELELKDLTIIAGANNTGKTYLAYTLYGFLKLVRQPRFLPNKDDLPFDSDKAVQEIIDTGKAQFTVKDLDTIAKKFVKNISQISASTLSDIFSTSSDNFDGAEFFFYPDYLYDENQDKSDVIKFNIKENYISAFFDKDVLSFSLHGNESSLRPEIIKDMLILSFLKLCVPNFLNLSLFQQRDLEFLFFIS